MDRYSRMVAFLKVLLPLAALAILSSLFLLGRGSDHVAEIPFAQHEIAERMRNQQVTAPFFSGTTEKGDELTVTASVARPGGAGEPAEAEALSARIRTVEGTQITLESEAGSFDLPADSATFEGNVRIVSSLGIELQSDLMTADIKGVRVESPGEVRGTALLGTLDAGAMLVTSKNQGGPIHMLFNNGVKLIYDPKQTER